MLAVPFVPPDAAKSFVMNRWVVGAMSICRLRLPVLGTENTLHPVVKLVVQYVSLKLVDPVPVDAPLKNMKRSEIRSPGAAVTSNSIVTSCDWFDATEKLGLNEKPSLPTVCCGVTVTLAGVGSVAPPDAEEANWN